MVVMTPDLWEKSMDRLRAAIGSDAYDAWLKDATLVDYSMEEGRLVLGVPNDFHLRWIKRNLLKDVKEVFGETFGNSLFIDIVVEEEEGEAKLNGTDEQDLSDATERSHRPFAMGRQQPADIAGNRRSGSPEHAPASGPHIVTQTPRLNPRYLFEDFVVGESNRFAHAAAEAVSDPSSKAFNPLFIYGPSGLGKTHLMHAIGHRMHQLDSKLRILYVPTEVFVNGFIESIQNKKHTEFRNSYRNVDLILIDDIQFIGGKERTQQEFFHTFNALHDAGKKVVVSSDRSPKELTTLEERLRSRFEWGLIVDVSTPDLETRTAILRKKATMDGFSLPNDVYTFVAERFTSNIRELEGALKQLKMAAQLHDRSIDLAAARDILGHLMVGSPAPRVTTEDIQKAVATYFSITVKEMLGTNRTKKFTQPRHLAQYLTRKLTELSFPDIAHKFGGKDHTSIIYAFKKVEEAVQKDPNMASIVSHLTKQITKGSDQ